MCSFLFEYFIHLNSHLIHFKGYNCIPFSPYDGSQIQRMCAKFVVDKKFDWKKNSKPINFSSKVESIWASFIHISYSINISFKIVTTHVSFRWADDTHFFLLLFILCFPPSRASHHSIDILWKLKCKENNSAKGRINIWTRIEKKWRECWMNR